MLFQDTIPLQSFSIWLRSDKENRRMVLAAIIIMLITFIWLKYIYPYPNFMPPDSYSYIEAAYKNEFINTWPIGYSRFIRLISSFSNSHFLLVMIQYLFLELAILYFLFSIRYLLYIKNWMFRILLTISVANPLICHIANFVSSDCLFAALSLVWFTQLLWILYKPSKILLLLHAIILLLAFMVRFAALYYPFCSIFIIMLQPMPYKEKLLGFSAVILPLLCFIGCTQYEYKAKTGTTQYSAFGGWQLAANALYGYAHAKPDNPNTVPFIFRELHTLVNGHMDSLRLLKHRPDKEVGIYYLWDFKSPLRLYMDKRWKNDSQAPWLKQWASMAPLYMRYGRWLIFKHPQEYIKFYLWPNLIRYYAPPPMFMNSYNLRSETVWPIATTWFGWSDNKLPTRANDREIHIASIFSTLLSIINPLFILSTIIFVILGGVRKCSLVSKKILLTMWLTWFTNMGFSILSAPTELRYQLFPTIITIPFCGLLLNWLIQAIQTVPTTKQSLIRVSDPVL